MVHDLVQAIQCVIDFAGVGGITVSSRQIITAWNDGARKLTNYDASEVVGRSCCEIMAGRDEQGQRLCRQGCRIALRAQFDGYVEPFNMLINTKDGRELWVNVVTIVIPSPLGDRATLFHFLQDVSRWKEGEQLMGQVLDAVTRFQAPLQRPRPATLPETPLRETTPLIESQAQPKEANFSTERKVRPEDMTSAAGSRLKDLTAREKEVLTLLIEGADTAAVAEKLVISYATARNHIQHILDKMGVHSRLEAIWAAIGQPH